MSATTAPTPSIAPASPRRLVDFVLRARTFGIVGVLAYDLISVGVSTRVVQHQSRNDDVE